MALTDIAARTSKPKEKPYKLSDSGGLYLLITDKGSKLWRLAYRFNGKQKSIAFGSYPDVTLAEAREARDAARKVLASGSDPSFQRKLRKQARAVTFRAVAEELLTKRANEGRASNTLDKNRWLLGFAFDVFGDRPVDEITAPEVLHVLRQVEARGRYETARRLRSTCSWYFAMRSPPRGRSVIPQWTCEVH